MNNNECKILTRWHQKTFLDHNNKTILLLYNFLMGPYKTGAFKTKS